MHFFVFQAPDTCPHFCNVKRKHFTCLILTLMQKYLFTFFLTALAGLAYGQGWERVYGSSNADAANDVALTPDGGFIVTGIFNNTRLYLLKTDANGYEQWSKNFTISNPSLALGGNEVIVTRDSGYLIVGYAEGADRDAYLIKTDQYGNKIWDKQFGNAQSGADDELLGVVELPDGSLVVTGYTETPGSDPRGDVLIARLDASGNQIWLKSYGAPGESREIGHCIAVMPDGNAIIAGDRESEPSSDRDVYIVAVSSLTGDTLWTNQYNVFGFIHDEAAYGITATPDGGFILAGSSTIGFAAPNKGAMLMKIDGTGNNQLLWAKAIPQTESFYDVAMAANGELFAAGYKEVSQGNVYIVRANASNGNLIWEKDAGKGGPDQANSLAATPDGGVIAAGYSQPFLTILGPQRAYLVKTDANGVLFTSYLNGRIFQDANGNCSFDNGESPMPNWIVVISSAVDTTFALADNDGAFWIARDTGTYVVRLFAPNAYWQTCVPFTSVNISAFYDTVKAEIAVLAGQMCPRNEVDIATPVLRRCADNVYFVRYCNSGTAPSINTQVTVELDPFMTVTGSSIPFTVQQDKLVFDLGTLQNGDCGDFNITAFLDCDQAVQQTHCVKATISPNDFCDPGTLWDGSIVRASALCDNDSVKMFLSNQGIGNMTQDLGFVIAEDVLMLTDPNEPIPFRLNAGQDSMVWTRTATGKTYRIIAQQSAGYPGLSIPTAAVEGCRTDTTINPNSVGYYTMFPEDDRDAFIETDCQESEETDFYPDFLKRGHPKGYDVPHYVSPKTDLDYLIQFRNEGSDTVHQVLIRDTLSAVLDPASVFPGASSHPYQFQVYGNGIVEFLIPNLNLIPGSSASEGFVKFRVAQKPDIECGTVILNSAAIYFDFNAPAISNQTFHTVCSEDEFLVVETKDIYKPGVDLKVYPNPLMDHAVFEVSGFPAATYELALFDNQGRLLFNRVYSSPTFRLFRNQIPAGVFYYRVSAEGTPIAAGKLMVK